MPYSLPTMRGTLTDYASFVPEGITPIGFDVETFLIKNNTAPQVVCMTFYDPRNETAKGYILDAKDGAVQLAEYLKDDSVWLIAHNAMFDFITSSLLSPKLFALIFRAYKRGRIHCTKLREALMLVGGPDNYGEIRGTVNGTKMPVSYLSLAGCLFTYFGKDVTGSKVKARSKGSPSADIWRLRYHELHGIPVQQWPIEAVDYAIADAEYALGVFLLQQKKAQRISAPIMKEHKATGTIIDDAQRQATAEFCLMYMGFKTGVKINQKKIQAAYDHLMQEHDAIIARIADFGYYTKVAKHKRGHKVVKARVKATFDRCYSILQYTEPSIYTEASLKAGKQEISTAKGPRDNLLRMVDKAIEYEVTPTTRVPLKQDKLDELAILAEALRTFADCEGLWKEINTFIKGLRRSRLSQDSRIRYNLNGFVATGRTSSSDPNMQNLPRGGAVRDCIEAEDGHIFIINDYSNAEMRSLGQENWDTQGAASMLAVEYRKDKHFDPHLYAAYQMINIEQGTSLTFDDAKAIYADKKHKDYKLMKKFRTLAKILNFGLAGGLSHVSFVDYARGYKVYMSIGESKRLCDMWKQVWSEMQTYFDLRSELFRTDVMGDELTTEAQRTYLFRQSNRARYLRKYTVGCNTPFQGISADGAKEAVIRTFQECYFMKKSPLYGCKPILFVHDEIVLECPYDGSEESHLKASEAALRLSKVMEVCMEKYTPDVPAVAEPTLSAQWTKDAESDIVDGVVQVWTPSEDAQDEDDDIEAVDPAEAARIAGIRSRVITIIDHLHTTTYGGK